MKSTDIAAAVRNGDAEGLFRAFLASKKSDPNGREAQMLMYAAALAERAQPPQRHNPPSIMSAAAELEPTAAAATEKTATKKRFRPIRTAARAIMKETSPKAKIRSDTLDMQEDLANRVIVHLAKRAKSVMDASGRKIMTIEDVNAGAKLAFKSGYTLTA